jgi:predicted transcriptional regulator
MKAILMSIQPKWVELIANGKKTIEVRKTRPKLETPFKVYIYCTKGKDLLREVDNWHTGTKTHTTNYRIINLDYCTNKIANGKVIGEFVCDRIDSYIGKGTDNKQYWRFPDTREIEKVKKESCLTIGQIIDYTGDSDNCYGWHITDLKIYDKPKELSEFKTFCRDAYCQDDYGTPTWFCKDGYSSCAVKYKEKEFPHDVECIYFDCPSVGGESCEYEDYEYCLCHGLKPVTRPFH